MGHLPDKPAAEEALRESEEQYRLLFEAANDGVVLGLVEY